MNNKMQFSEEGFQLFMKITSDINKKNKEDARILSNKKENPLKVKKEKHKIKNVLLITDQGIKSLGLTNSLEEHIKNQKINS